MGIFVNDTEDNKQLKQLVRAIKSSRQEATWRDYLVDYVNQIIDGKKYNQFGSIHNLCRVCLTLADYVHLLTPNTFFDKLNNIMNLLLPYGEKTEDYEQIIEMIINYFICDYGIIERDTFDPKFYALFDNRLDYLQIMKSCDGIDDFDEAKHFIFNFAKEVAKYCPNQQVLKNEILSFANVANCLSNPYEYMEKSLEEAKKRAGIYPVDEKTLALISDEAERAQELIERLNRLKKKVFDYEAKIKEITENGQKTIKTQIETGVKEIKDYKEEANNDLQSKLSETKKDILEELTSYIATLEATLKKSSDQVFNNILEKSADKLREIKLAAERLSSDTTTELLRIQNATEESVSKLRQYVEDEPQIRQLLTSASDNEKIKDMLLSISQMQANTGANVVTSTSSIVTPANGIIISGNERLVVPANDSVVLPQNYLEKGLNPLFDQRTPFKERIKIIEDRKAQREANGEFFHDLTMEIVTDVITGDWVYLYGPSGCGKSYMIRQVAELLGLELVDNGKITEKYSVMAYNDANGNFRATQTFASLYYGKFLSLDEFDNGNNDTQICFNSIYSGLLDVIENPDAKRYITFADDMTVPINPNFRMISAGNTTGEGENDAFSSRGKIDESVLQRLTPIKFVYDNKIEEKILGQYRSWYNIFVKFRKICELYAQREGLTSPVGITTTRDAAAICKYIKDNSKSVDQIIREKFIQIKNDSYLAFISKKFKEEYNLKNVTESDIYEPERLSEVEELDIARRLVLNCNKED